MRATKSADSSPLTVRLPGRRGLQLWLGLIWLVDAALQFQPFMFRPSFVTAVIEPAATGNPGFVTTSVNWASQLMLHQVAACNAVFATVQLLIALGLSVRRTVKPALVLSIIWALLVWWFGESLGGILVGLSPLAGVPGAVLLYALIAIFVWPSSPRPAGARTSVAAAGPTGGVAATIAWLALWGGFAHYLLLPANRAPEAISRLLSDTDGQPGWLAAIMNSLSRAAAGHGVEISVVLAILCAGIALAMLAGPSDPSSACVGRWSRRLVLDSSGARRSVHRARDRPGHRAAAGFAGCVLHSTPCTPANPRGALSTSPTHANPDELLL